MDLPETRVGVGILITGRLEGEGNVVIEGRVDGEINIKGDLHIDTSGQVKAAVHARNIYLMGILVGNAQAADKLEIAEGGRMIGDIRAPRVLINEGAAFSGMVDMPDFEAAEDRAGEGRSVIRRLPRPAATAPQPRPAAPPRQVSAPASTSPRPASAARPQVAADPNRGAQRTGGGTLYSPPPLPRPPEFAGVRKAIIIKKKPTPEG